MFGSYQYISGTYHSIAHCTLSCTFEPTAPYHTRIALVSYTYHIYITFIRHIDMSGSYQPYRADGTISLSYHTHINYIIHIDMSGSCQSYRTDSTISHSYHRSYHLYQTYRYVWLISTTSSRWHHITFISHSYHLYHTYRYVWLMSIISRISEMYHTVAH